MSDYGGGESAAYEITEKTARDRRRLCRAFHVYGLTRSDTGRDLVDARFSLAEAPVVGDDFRLSVAAPGTSITIHLKRDELLALAQAAIELTQIPSAPSRDRDAMTIGMLSAQLGDAKDDARRLEERLTYVEKEYEEARQQRDALLSEQRRRRADAAANVKQAYETKPAYAAAPAKDLDLAAGGISGLPADFSPIGARNYQGISRSDEAQFTSSRTPEDAAAVTRARLEQLLAVPADPRD